MTNVHLLVFKISRLKNFGTHENILGTTSNLGKHIPFSNKPRICVFVYERTLDLGSSLSKD